MKKFFVFLATILFIFSGITFAGCKGNNSSIIENLDGYVANLSSYSNIGVATVNNTYSSIASNSQNNSKLLFMNTNIVYAQNDNHNKTCLVGVGDENEIKEINFQKQDSIINSKLNIRSFNQTKRYIIITYTDDDVTKIYDTQFLNGKRYRTYILDKETNSVYKFDSFEHFDIGMYGYGIMGSDCEDYFIINAGLSYYKVGVVNEELKIQEIFKQNTIPDGAEIRLCDKYGNCIIQRYNNMGFYVLNNQGKLTSLNQTLDLCSGIDHPGTTYRAIDGCIYNGNYVLNENGDFVEASYIPNEYILPSESLVYSTETADYYFIAKKYDSSRNYMWFYTKTLIKVQKNNNEYTFEEIPFNVNDKGFQSGDAFYSFENDTDIIKTNILTGEQKIITVENNIIISSISVHDYNQIQFVGINENLQTVKGIIYNNETVSFNYEEPDFIAFFIQPLMKHVKNI